MGKAAKRAPPPARSQTSFLVPDGADGPDEGPLLVLVFRQEKEKRPDAEVEAVENGIAGEEKADEQEPDAAEQVPGRHQTSPRVASAEGSPGPPWIVRRMTISPATPMRA